MPGEGARGIEHVFGELGRKVREPLHHLAVALFAIGRQIDTGETKITQRVLEQLALRRIEACALGPLHVRVRRIQRLVLAELRRVGGEQRHAGVVGLAHRF